MLERVVWVTLRALTIHLQSPRKHNLSPKEGPKHCRTTAQQTGQYPEPTAAEEHSGRSRVGALACGKGQARP